MRKYKLERASVLNTASATDGLSFVIASSATDTPKVELSAFGCKACKAVFASTKGAEPFCVNCGSVEVHPNTESAKIRKIKDAELCAINCKNCGTHNVVAAQTASLMDGHMHCVECGTSLTYESDDLADPISEATEDSIEDALNTTRETADSISPEDRGGMTNGDPLNDVSETDVADALPTTKETAADGDAADATDKPAVDPATTVTAGPEENFGGKQAAPFKAQTAEGAEDVNAPVAPTVVNMEDEVVLEHAWNFDKKGDDKDDEDKDDEEACDEYSNVSLAAVVLSRNPKAELSLVHTDDAIHAFAAGVPVAVLERANAGDNAEVFHSQAFARAIARAAETSGVIRALAHFKFVPVTVDFPQRAVAKARAAKIVEAASASLNSKADTLVADFTQCLSLAAVGLTKNVWKQKANAIKRGFIDTLTTAGVKNAAAMVDKVFAAHGDAYHAELLSTAQDLMNKSVDARNELSETLGEMNALAYEGAPNPAEQEVKIDHAEVTADSLGSQMENAALRGGRQPVTASSSNIREIRRAAGGSLFN